MPTLAARLLKSELQPNATPIHLRIFNGWSGWTNVSLASGQASDAVSLGALGYQFRDGPTGYGDGWFLSGADSFLLPNFTGPNGNYYAVAYIAATGEVVTASPISGPTQGATRVLNYARLHVIGDAVLHVNEASTSDAGNTFGGRLLYIGGFVNWVNLPWTAMLVDDSWVPAGTGTAAGERVGTRQVRFLSDIPASAYVQSAAITGRFVSDAGAAYADNMRFDAVPPGRRVTHVAIFHNTGNPATCEVARIVSMSVLSPFGGLVTAGTDPVWIDWRGFPVLWFGYGTNG